MNLLLFTKHVKNYRYDSKMQEKQNTSIKHNRYNTNNFT